MFFGRKTVRLSTSPLWIIENLTQVEAAFKAEVPRQSLFNQANPPSPVDCNDSQAVHAIPD
jgi:hypothetical protein